MDFGCFSKLTSRKYRGLYIRIVSPTNHNTAGEKKNALKKGHMLITNEMGPGVRMSKRSLFVCHIRLLKMLYGTSRISVNRNQNYRIGHSLNGQDSWYINNYQIRSIVGNVWYSCVITMHIPLALLFPREDAGGLSRECVLRIPSVS